MLSPESPFHGRATGSGLPNGNHEEGVIARVAKLRDGEAERIDRRSIPSHAGESRWTAADGHELRRIDWPGRADGPRGSILFFPGRGDFYEKYLETLEQWHRAGWRVTAADWRGQAGSGRLGMDEVTGHIDDFDLWLDDLAHFWRSWKAETPGPHVLAGHSMGGHLVLRGVVDGRVDPDALVLSAPMLGFVGPPLPVSLLHAVARLMKRIGDPRRPAWKWSEKPGEMPARRNDLLTGDADRYADELWWRGHRPELVMGPGSWGWVESGYVSMKSLFAPGRLEAAAVPTLILAAPGDRLVSFEAIETTCARMPLAELVDLGPDARHEVLRDVDAVRDRAMTAIDEFLQRVVPAGQ